MDRIVPNARRRTAGIHTSGMFSACFPNDFINVTQENEAAAIVGSSRFSNLYNYK